MDSVKIQKLEDQLGHEFINKGLLIRALTHPTFSNVERMKKGEAKRNCPDQEIFTTLGDAILKAGLVLILIERGVKTKGNITISKADLESNLHLAKVGERLRLLDEDYIFHRVGKGEKLSEDSTALCSDTVEALIGSIFIDSKCDMLAVKKSILKMFDLELDELERKYLKL